MTGENRCIAICCRRKVATSSALFRCFKTVRTSLYTYAGQLMPSSETGRFDGRNQLLVTSTTANVVLPFAHLSGFEHGMSDSALYIGVQRH